ncbi:TetR/AcrR family transcriptional regulator [Williamsia deligens]|uniref:TetR/AcrR family transcriptional regulator n=1 Tax=Williamsia deligens TaxID=321325 RepID=A0ABW3G7G2_9NOCA|nr:TetR/AcrR family transcriptional regulator [Williamsia deligens]MCP2193027.1 transcriptional regulator, TetR family [Williamsia deligens]
MEVNGRPRRRTQSERNAATRSALMAAARPLFGAAPFADVATQAIVDAAGVTRGALYHHFGDKKGLFVAVFDEVEGEITQTIAERVVEAGEADPLAAMRLGARVFLEAFVDPVAQTIVLVEAPSVMGWKDWRARGEHFGMALVGGMLQTAVQVGAIAEQPTRPLAHIAIAAIDEAALYVAAADDPDRARAEMLVVLDRLIDSFAAG